MGLAEEKQVSDSLQQGRIYYFPLEANDISHYYILINKNPKADKELYFLCGRSQVDKIKRIYQSRSPETLVVIKAGEHKNFSVGTIFNCNNRFIRSVSQLAFSLELRQLKILYPITDNYLKQIIRGVKISMTIESYVKKSL